MRRFQKHIFDQKHCQHKSASTLIKVLNSYRQIRGLGEEQRGNPVSQLGSYVELPGRKKRNRDEESRNRPPGRKLIYGFTPRSFFNAFIQYNADTHLVSSNIRFNWTHHPLSDVYIVYNDTRNTLTHEARERGFIIKLTNLFRF